MSTFRHPAFRDILCTVPDERDDETRAAGWIPVEQEAALRRPVPVARERATKTPPPAVRKK